MERNETKESEERLKRQDKVAYNAIQTLIELGREIEELSEEKKNLLEIEKKLKSEIEKETNRREKKRDRLKTEVEGLKDKCEELASFVNKFREEQVTTKKPELATVINCQ